MLKFFKKIAKRQSGRKFRYLYLQLKDQHHIIRFVIACSGVLCILIGICLLVLPGPGLLFIFIGLGLIGAISQRLARNLDRLEFYLEKKYRQWRQNGTKK